jgi:hypothetical protein
MLEKDLPSLIRFLTDRHETGRQQSADAIFRGGCELIAQLLRQWLSDPKLAPYMVGATGFPQITVGLAVQPPNFELIRDANGSPRLADVPPDQDAREFELNFERGVHLDILTSADPAGSGAIARYLRKFGEGIQQIEINVSDVDRAIEILRGRFAVQPVYPTARQGANGTRVNFFLAPALTGGKVLIELVQSSPQAQAQS